VNNRQRSGMIIVGEKMKVEDRIKGAIYGIAVGDALGAVCEFRRPADIRNIYGTVTEMIGTSEFAPGEFTDDTWLTLATAQAYDGEECDIDRAGKAMVTWMTVIGKGIGRMTSMALGHIRGGRCDARDAGIKALASTAVGKDAGNGSLMRCAATGLVRVSDKEITEDSIALSKITHASPKCLASCVAYNKILFAIVNYPDNYDLLHHIKKTAEEVAEIDQDTADVLTGVLDGEQQFKPGIMKGMGYVLRSLERSVAALISNDSFENQLIDIVNEGGDADTNGAIAGGLLGAKYGYDAIPQRWIDPLLHKDELDEVCEIITRFRGKE